MEECLFCRTRNDAEIPLKEGVDVSGKKVFVCPCCHEVYELVSLV